MIFSRLRYAHENVGSIFGVGRTICWEARPVVGHFDDLGVAEVDFAEVVINRWAVVVLNYIGLEYLSLGVPCFSGIDSLTEKVVKDLTGCSWLPWIKSSKDNFERVLRGLIKERETIRRRSLDSRRWMETYWVPQTLAQIYVNMYEKL